MERAKVGVIHGRFQGLHFGHMEYLLSGKDRCDFLYIGITNPDPMLSAVNENDLKRSEKMANPFNYYERADMIRCAMVENRIGLNEFEIVPFPINFPHLLENYVPLDAIFFVTIYDQWGKHKLKVLEDLGCKIDLMWTRTMDQRFSTGQEVRTLIAENEKWEHLVPSSVASYIKEKHLDTRIKSIKYETV